MLLVSGASPDSVDDVRGAKIDRVRSHLLPLTCSSCMIWLVRGCFSYWNCHRSGLGAAANCARHCRTRIQNFPPFLSVCTTRTMPSSSRIDHQQPRPILQKERSQKHPFAQQQQQQQLRMRMLDQQKTTNPQPSFSRVSPQLCPTTSCMRCSARMALFSTSTCTGAGPLPRRARAVA